MKRYRRGEAAKPGFYLDLRRAEFIQVTRDANHLSDNLKGNYVHVPSILAAIIMAILGFGMVIFLPFAAIVGLIAFIGSLFRRRPARECAPGSNSDQIE